MMLVTWGAMLALNYIAGKNATARKIIRGTPVASVEGSTNESGGGFMTAIFG